MPFISPRAFLSWRPFFSFFLFFLFFFFFFFISFFSSPQARDEFYHNGRHFLLYTERAHFYRRFRIKGIRHLIFYQVSFLRICHNITGSASRASDISSSIRSVFFSIYYSIAGAFLSPVPHQGHPTSHLLSGQFLVSTTVLPVPHQGHPTSHLLSGQCLYIYHSIAGSASRASDISSSIRSVFIVSTTVLPVPHQGHPASHLLSGQFFLLSTIVK
jgi:hypothetical protein